MVIRFVCRACGYVLYEVKDADANHLRTYARVIELNNGKCPSCGRRLEPPDIKDITFRPRFRIAKPK